MRRLRSRIAPLFLAASLAASLPAFARPAEDKPSKRTLDEARAALADPEGIAALQYRSIGPAWGGRVSRAAGVAGDPLIYYAATAAGGVWKSSDGGLTLEADLRRPADLLDRLDRRRAVRPQRRLRRLRRGQHPRQRRGRQRHLQVDRRRQDLEARLEAGGADRHHRGPPEEPRRRLRRGARPRLRPQPGARRLPHRGRRQDLGAGAQEGRRHRRLRRGTRPEQPQCRLRRPLAGPPQALGDDQRRPGQRPVRVARRRRDLEAVDRRRRRRRCRGRRPAGRRLGQGRRRGRAVRQPAGLRPDRGGRGRPVPLRRRRRDLDPDERRPAPAPARLVLHHAHRRPGEPRRGLGAAGADAQEHRRRQDLRLRQGHPPRRPPRPVDRPARTRSA